MRSTSSGILYVAILFLKSCVVFSLSQIFMYNGPIILRGCLSCLSLLDKLSCGTLWRSWLPSAQHEAEAVKRQPGN